LVEYRQLGRDRPPLRGRADEIGVRLVRRPWSLVFVPIHRRCPHGLGPPPHTKDKGRRTIPSPLPLDRHRVFCMIPTASEGPCVLPSGGTFPSADSATPARLDGDSNVLFSRKALSTAAHGWFAAGFESESLHPECGAAAGGSPTRSLLGGSIEVGSGAKLTFAATPGGVGRQGMKGSCRWID